MEEGGNRECDWCGGGLGGLGGGGTGGWTEVQRGRVPFAKPRDGFVEALEGNGRFGTGAGEREECEPARTDEPAPRRKFAPGSRFQALDPEDGLRMPDEVLQEFYGVTASQLLDEVK